MENIAFTILQCLLESKLLPFLLTPTSSPQPCFNEYSHYCWIELNVASLILFKSQSKTFRMPQVAGFYISVVKCRTLHEKYF